MPVIWRLAVIRTLLPTSGNHLNFFSGKDCTHNVSMNHHWRSSSCFTLHTTRLQGYFFGAIVSCVYTSLHGCTKVQGALNHYLKIFNPSFFKECVEECCLFHHKNVWKDNSVFLLSPHKQSSTQDLWLNASKFAECVLHSAHNFCIIPPTHPEVKHAVGLGKQN